MSIRLRLDCEPRYPGESYSSFVERLAQSYLLTTEQLIVELLGRASLGSRGGDIDRYPSDLLTSTIGVAVGTGNGSWRDSDVPKFNFWVLSPRRRFAYCPKCFVDDLNKNQTPHFREKWIGVMASHCLVHESPLMEWRVTKGSMRVLPKKWLGFQSHDLCEVEQAFWSDVALLENDEAASDDDFVMLRLELKRVLSLYKLLEGGREGPLIDRFGSALVKSLCNMVAWSLFDPASGRPVRVLPIDIEPSEPYFGDLNISTRLFRFGHESTFRLAPSLAWRRSVMLGVCRLLETSGLLSAALAPFRNAEWDDRWGWLLDSDSPVIVREALAVERAFAARFWGCNFSVRVPRRNKSVL